MKLKDKVALITGAGSGLGRQTSLLFVREGAKVVMSDVSTDRVEAAVRWVNTEAGSENAVAVTADVRKEQDLADAVKHAEDTFGRLDIAFANAGIVSRGGVPGLMGGENIEFQDLSEDDWHDVLGVNLTGVVLTCKHAVPALRRAGGGSIVCTSSAASLQAYPNIAMYSATKAGVNGLVKGLSYDLGRYGIRVNAILPTHGMSPNFLMPPDEPVVGQSYEQVAGPWDSRLSPIPLKKDRPPDLDDNARIVLFLASDESAYMSGVCLPATDGGTLSRVAMVFEEDEWAHPEGP